MQHLRSLLVTIAALTYTLIAEAQTLGSPEWLFGVGGGMNVGFDGKAFDDRPGSHIGAGTALDLYAGAYLTPVFGVRAGYQGLGISDQYTVYGKERYRLVHADALFRVHPSVVPYVHAGYAHITSGSIAGGLGLQLSFPVSQSLRIVSDTRATALSGHAFPARSDRLAGVLSGTLGLQLTLGKTVRKTPAAEPVQEVVIPVVPGEPAIEKTPEPEPETAAEVTVVVVPDTPAAPVPMTEAPAPERNYVLFPFNSAQLTEEAQATLNEWVTYLLDEPGKAVSVEGHTCDIGKSPYNKGLSEQRAEAVRTYLVRAGVAPARISLEAFGSTRPAEPNDTPAARAHNRRAVIVVK